MSASALVLRSLEAAGLLPVLEARRAGDLARVRDFTSELETADLLAVGALADCIRAEECGNDVRVFMNVAPALEPEVICVSLADANRAGFVVLRRVAVARITGPRSARVRVDWAESGLEVAQVALGFGANEIVGPLATRRGLPIAEDRTRKVKGEGMVLVSSLKKKELAALLTLAGRRAVFLPDTASSSGPRESPTHV